MLNTRNLVILSLLSLILAVPSGAQAASRTWKCSEESTGEKLTISIPLAFVPMPSLTLPRASVAITEIDDAGTLEFSGGKGQLTQLTYEADLKTAKISSVSLMGPAHSWGTTFSLWGDSIRQMSGKAKLSRAGKFVPFDRLLCTLQDE